MDYQEFRKYLFSFQDLKYQEFTQKLTPTKYSIIGIRVPRLRKIAREIEKNYGISYLEIYKDDYFEEIFIAFLILANIKDEEIFNNYFNKLVLKLDNWEICDAFCNSFLLPKIKHEEYFKWVIDLIKTNEEFKTRCGLIIILNNYIEENKLKEIFKAIDEIKIDAYYSNMAIAWLLCEIYIFYPIITEKYFLKTKINDFTMNKTISKIKESYRIDSETKEYLNRYKRKIK